MSESTMTDTVEAVARAIATHKKFEWGQLTGDEQTEVLAVSGVAIAALKSAGYLSPEQVKARDAAVERRALDRAANWHDEKIISTTYPDEVAFHEYSRDAILALSPSPTNWQEVPEGLECVAFRVCNDNYSLWIASTVAHDIMSQGDSFEEAKSRLEVAINADADGLKTGPSPIVKTFRAMIKAGSKP